jgi:hypothetical protein
MLKDLVILLPISKEMLWLVHSLQGMVFPCHQHHSHKKMFLSIVQTVYVLCDRFPCFDMKEKYNVKKKQNKGIPNFTTSLISNKIASIASIICLTGILRPSGRESANSFFQAAFDYIFTHIFFSFPL